MRARRLMTAGLLVATVGLVLAGCGGGGSKKSESSATTEASKAAGGGATVNLVTKDFKFDPTTLTAKAGEKVTVKIKNEGQAEHNFSISSLSVDKDIEKGEDATATFTPTQGGSIQFFCKYHKDSQGMVGTLTVT